MKKKDVQNLLKIDSGTTIRFDNAHHAEFHRQQYEDVLAVAPAKLKLPAGLLEEWKKNIDLEVAINKESDKSVQTAQMMAKDKERDQLLTYFFGVVRINRIAPDEIMRKAADRLDAKIGPYYGIQSDPMDAENLHIIGMRADLEQLAGEVATLGLVPTLSKLYAINDEFVRLYKERRDQSLAVILPSSREIRPKTDEAFDKICIYIVAANIHATDEDRGILSNLITKLNKNTYDFRTRYNEIIAQRKAAAKKKKEKEGGGGEDDKKKPSDPKKPDDGKTPKPGREEDPGEDKA